MSDLDSKLNSVTLLDRAKALFARNEFIYWFSHFTDEEKHLRRMNVWQLAEVIRQSTDEKQIVAEHFLNLRLIRLQNSAVLIAAVFSIMGAVIGALISSLMQQPQNVECVYQHATEAQPNNSATNARNINIDTSSNTKSVEPPNTKKASNDHKQ